MSDAEHFGPLLLGGTQNNKGPVVLAQSRAISYRDSLTSKYLFTIPAGSMITGFTLYVTDNFTTPGGGGNYSAQLELRNAPSAVSFAGLGSRNANLGIGVVNYAYYNVLGSSSAYYAPVLTPNNATNAALWSNVGSTDMPVYVYLYNYYNGDPASNDAYTSGAGVITVTYALRKPDGTLRQLDY